MEFPIQQGGGISNSEPSTSAPENDYRQFYEIIDNREQVIEKFYGTRQRMTISVHSLEHCPNPEAVLLHIFQEAIDIARSRARANGLNPETVGANVISAALDYDMWTPIRRYNEDTAASILHRFECMNTYKENRLIQAPFDVEITCFDTKTFGATRGPASTTTNWGPWTETQELRSFPQRLRTRNDQNMQHRYFLPIPCTWNSKNGRYRNKSEKIYQL